MVVVADAALVERRRSRGLDPPDEAVVGQDAEGVVHRLTRNRPDLGASMFGDLFRRAVRMARHRPQHGQSLGRNVHTMFTKQRSGVRSHGLILRRNLDRVQSLTDSISTLLAGYFGCCSLASSWRLTSPSMGSGEWSFARMIACRTRSRSCLRRRQVVTSSFAESVDPLTGDRGGQEVGRSLLVLAEPQDGQAALFCASVRLYRSQPISSEFGRSEPKRARLRPLRSVPAWLVLGTRAGAFCRPASSSRRCLTSILDRQIDSRLRDPPNRDPTIVQPDFSPTTWEVFQRSGVDGVPAGREDEVLGRSENAVLLAKSRVLKRLREEAGDLLW